MAQVRVQAGAIYGIRLSLVDRSRLAPRVFLRVTKTNTPNSMATRIGADVASSLSNVTYLFTTLLYH